jgi:release factor glutamine methyltransferase
MRAACSLIPPRRERWPNAKSKTKSPNSEKSSTLAVMQSTALYQLLVRALTLPVGEPEKQTMIRWLLEDRLGLTAAALLSGKEVSLTPDHFAHDMERLNAEEPIQYVLGHSEFFGRKFLVNSSVLIPRPETEYLARLVIDGIGKQQGNKVLDIGTGSGCIAITLALELPRCDVHATDVSAAALAVARENARLLNATAKFHLHNILEDELPFTDLDVIVSNPPYIRQSESASMERNVKGYEPPIALFVPDEDPLLFYRTIAQKARLALRPAGLLALEINEGLGRETQEETERAGFSNVRLHLDQHGKQRCITALAPY